MKITIVIRSSNFESENNVKTGRLKLNLQTFAVFWRFWKLFCAEVWAMEVYLSALRPDLMLFLGNTRDSKSLMHLGALREDKTLAIFRPRGNKL